MAEAPIPAEVALAAFDEILDAISNFECLGYKDSQRIRLHAMRAAFRALAEMPPTKRMFDASAGLVADACSYIRAAASEGEDQV